MGNSVIWATANAGAGAQGGKHAHLDLDYPNQQDVRDLARAHVVALQKDEEEVKGKRFILAAEEFDYPLVRACLLYFNLISSHLISFMRYWYICIIR